MTTRTLSLQLEEDFTTHTAALFVSHVNVFQSTIRIIGFRQGQQVQVAADGPDEAEAVNALSQFFQSSASA